MSTEPSIHRRRYIRVDDFCAVFGLDEVLVLEDLSYSKVAYGANAMTMFSLQDGLDIFGERMTKAAKDYIVQRIAEDEKRSGLPLVFAVDA